MLFRAFSKVATITGLSLVTGMAVAIPAMAEMKPSGGPDCVPIVDSDGTPTAACRTSFTPPVGDPQLPDSLGRNPSLAQALSQTQDQGDWPDDLTGPPEDVCIPASLCVSSGRGSGRIGPNGGTTPPQSISLLGV